MANGSSFAALNRRAQRGNFQTSGGQLPTSESPIGAVDDPQAAALSVPIEVPDKDLLDFLGGQSLVTEARSSAPAAGSGASAASGAAAGVTGGPVVGGGQASSGASTKLAAVPGVSPFAALAAARSGTADATGAAPRDYEGASTPFSDLVKPGQEASTTAARRDVHAVKVVTRLVRAIAFKPGTAADKRVKSTQLQAMLLEVDRAAREVMLAAAPLDAHRGWVRALCTEAMAELVAARNESDAFGESTNLDEAIQVVKEVFVAADEDRSIAQAVDGMRGSAYAEASTEGVANDRVRVSFGLACWELYDSVTHPRLGVEAYRYTYERKAEDIVARMADEAMKLARDMNIRIGNLDMRTAHLQGSLRRAAQLIGSEYVNRTRQIMNWIGEASSDEEYRRRLQEAEKAFDHQILPEVVELARRNFVAIEQLAPRLLEESQHANDHTQRHGA